MHKSRINTNEKISSVIALMAETLRYQKPIMCPAEPSWMQPIPKFGISTRCDEHENCLSTIEFYRKTVLTNYPECAAQKFQKDGVPYFIIYSEFNQLSMQLSRGKSECAAWKKAMEFVVNEQSKIA